MITGLHNGDALRAWKENGIRYAVGDNTRSAIRNQESSFYPLTTTVAANGYDGIVIIGRWATTIYFNCDFPDCIVQEWKSVTGRDGSFSDILREAKEVNTKHLLGLHWDPFMFHQANMRVVDAPAQVINGVNRQYSLLMAWVEAVAVEMARL